MPTTVLIATPSGATSNSYTTIEEMDELLEGFDMAKVVEKWDDLEDDVKCQLLLEATRLIDQYRGWGPTRDSAQRLAFPRATDPAGAIPEAVRRAVAEYVAYKVDGSMVPLKKLQEEGVTSASILGQSSSFEKDRSGLPAGARRELDKLWTAHWPKSVFNRELSGETDPDSFFG